MLNHCRRSLASSLWLAAEYQAFVSTSSMTDILPFSVYTQEYESGQPDAFGVHGLVIDRERTHRDSADEYSAYATYKGQAGFLKCSYSTRSYANEIRSLLALNRLDPPMPSIPKWHGYDTAIPFQKLKSRLVTYFRTADGYGCTVLSLVDGIQLNEYAVSLSPLQRNTELRDVARQLLIVLAYLHSAGWAHGDIKPKNIMVNVVSHQDDDKPNVEVTLVDFNWAIPSAEKLHKPLGRTLGFTPPEYYSSKQINMQSFDVWSLGTTLYALFMGHAPYEVEYDSEGNELLWPKKKRRKFMRNLIKHQQHKHKPLNCSEEARDFIESLMRINPSDRPTMKEMMQHAWLR
ncbi:kinase-like domain-containing protein [Syncephalis fuscata]|nr:kinase-like domain-containing protein [Syncephalis fuscata]